MEDVNVTGGPLLVVIPCSAAKLWHAAPAGELYTGSWHKLARSTADALVEQHGGQVVILSALHGLLALDDEVAPYDLAMGAPGSVQPAQLALQLLQLLPGVGPARSVVALLPKAYLAALREAMAELPATVRPELVTPLVGASGVGYQRQRLATLRQGSGLATA